MEKARSGFPKDRSGVGCRALLVREVALPDRGLDCLSLQIQQETRLGGPRRSCQTIFLEQRRFSRFWRTVAAFAARAAAFAHAHQSHALGCVTNGFIHSQMI